MRITRGGVLKLVVSAGLVALLVWKVDLSEVGAILARANPLLVVAAILVGHLDRGLQASKWRLLVTSSGVPVSLGAAVSSTYAGNFAGQFLPSGVGGDVVRVVLLREMKLPTAEVVASIAIERAFGMLALAFTAGAAVLIAKGLGLPLPEGLDLAVLVALVGLLVVTAASFRLGIEGLLELAARLGARFKLGERLGALADAYRRYGKRKRAVVVYSVLSVLEVLTVTAVFTLCAWALGIDIAAPTMMLVVPVTLVAHRIPISIGGIGVQEGMLGWFLTSLGHGLDEALALGVAMRVVETFILLPGAFLWLGFRRRAAAAGP